MTIDLDYDRRKGHQEAQVGRRNDCDAKTLPKSLARPGLPFGQFWPWIFLPLFTSTEHSTKTVAFPSPLRPPLRNHRRPQTDPSLFFCRSKPDGPLPDEVPAPEAKWFPIGQSKFLEGTSMGMNQQDRPAPEIGSSRSGG